MKILLALFLIACGLAGIYWVLYTYDSEPDPYDEHTQEWFSDQMKNRDIKS